MDIFHAQRRVDVGQMLGLGFRPSWLRQTLPALNASAVMLTVVFNIFMLPFLIISVYLLRFAPAPRPHQP
jgi:hypothetical protein